MVVDDGGGAPVRKEVSGDGDDEEASNEVCCRVRSEDKEMAVAVVDGNDEGCDGCDG